MNKYSKALLSLLKEQFINIVGNKSFQTKSETRSYYLEKFNDNLYKPMDKSAEEAYVKRGGNEIYSGKMNALRSSSALTYNLLWNQIANFKGNSERIGKGSYKVEFEKQFAPLKPSASNRPANLDAFLYCKETQEAVACEMKMMEWILNKPATLKRKYLEFSNYAVDEKSSKIFVDIANKLLLQNITKYDAFQMFKHTVACYTACASKKTEKISKLTLVNCVWTLSTPEKLEPKYRNRYIEEEKCELKEFEVFRQIMRPVIKLFEDIGVDFDIRFYTFNEFLSLLDKSNDEKQYLRRYTLL